MAKTGKGTWGLGLVILALGAWWLLHQASPEAPVPGPQPVPATPVVVATEIVTAATPLPDTRPRLALVIDDWGYQSKPIAALADLGIPVTTAILPHLAFSQKAAEASYAAGNEVILHCPMQAKGPIKAEQGTLTVKMSSAEVLRLLAKHWAAIPHVIGLNNHEGSLASEDPKLMALVAGFLKEKHGFFLDSVTTARSAIPKAAAAAGIPWARRRVFLDNDESLQAIRSQLVLAVASAKKNGTCIAIGHPHASTLAVLKEDGAGLEAQGIHLVHLSELMTH